MARLLDLVGRFARDARGATAIEYALIAAIVGLGIVAALFTFGGELPNVFNRVGTALSNQN